MKKGGKEKDKVTIPIDTTNELIMLAAVINDEKARRKYINLSPDLFLGPGHMEMWTCLQEIFRRDLDYSPEVVKSIAGDAFDHKTLDEYARSREGIVSNLAHHAERLRYEKMRHEAAIGVVPLFIDALRNPQTEPEDLKSLINQLQQTFIGGGSKYIQSGRSVVAELKQELKGRREGTAICSFGIDALDNYCQGDTVKIKVDGDWVDKDVSGLPRMVPGLAPGLITALTGLSGSGKSVFSARLIKEQVKNKKRILWGAWEMPKVNSMEMVGTISGGFSRTEFMSGRFNEDDEDELIEILNERSDYIDFFSLPDIRPKGDKFERFNDKNLDAIHQAIAESGCDIFIADIFKYALHEMKPEEESRAIKRMGYIAKKEKCHVILVHHLNLKELEGREDKRPTRDAVMGSSGWINDVDNALSFHNPYLFGKDCEINNKFEIHILKQRYGIWPQAIEFEWDADTGWFENGKTISVARAGEEEKITQFLDDDPRPPTDGKKKKYKSTRRRSY